MAGGATDRAVEGNARVEIELASQLVLPLGQGVRCRDIHLGRQRIQPDGDRDGQRLVLDLRRVGRQPSIFGGSRPFRGLTSQDFRLDHLGELPGINPLGRSRLLRLGTPGLRLFRLRRLARLGSLLWAAGRIGGIRPRFARVTAPHADQQPAAESQYHGRSKPAVHTRPPVESLGNARNDFGVRPMRATRAHGNHRGNSSGRSRPVRSADRWEGCEGGRVISSWRPGPRRSSAPPRPGCPSSARHSVGGPPLTAT